VLKGNLQAGSRIGFLRKALIAGQFTASIVLIIGTFMIGRQLKFLREKDLGYNKHSIITIQTNMPRRDGIPVAERFEQELSTNRHVVASSLSLYSFTEPGWVNLGFRDQNEVYHDIRVNAIDEDFIRTMNLQLKEGRNLSEKNPADLQNAMLINEAMVRKFNLQNPIGSELPGPLKYRIVGVVKDFHFESLHTPIRPLALVLRPDSLFRRASDIGFVDPPQPRITVKLAKGDLQEQIAGLKSAWKKVAGNQDFQFTFLDEKLNAAYEQETRLSKMVNAASILSIFIACMGLFGLVTLVVARRTREIGIRKVLGANVSGIVRLLSRDFIMLVLISSVIAFPIAWWAINKWLQDFAYRAGISWWLFIVAGALSLFIALATVSIQAVRAAKANPVRSLRTE
jgi:putative ABC transport system permease protein